MRVLLDECVPRRLRSQLVGHSVRTVVEMGWAGIKNGQLLQRAASEFDCFLTTDKNLQFQQQVAGLPIAVLVVHAVDNSFETLVLQIESIRDALKSIGKNELKVVGA